MVSWYKRKALRGEPTTYILAESQTHVDAGRGQAIVRNYGPHEWGWLLLTSPVLKGKAKSLGEATEAADKVSYEQRKKL